MQNESQTPNDYMKNYNNKEKKSVSLSGVIIVILVLCIIFSTILAIVISSYNKKIEELTLNTTNNEITDDTQIDSTFNLTLE